MVAQIAGEPYKIEGFFLAKPLEVMVWEDMDCVWVENREFEILEHGKTRKEVLLRVFEHFLSLALSCKDVLNHEDRDKMMLEPCEHVLCEKAREYIGWTSES